MIMQTRMLAAIPRVIMISQSVPEILALTDVEAVGQRPNYGILYDVEMYHWAIVAQVSRD